ncbi:MAG: HAMP domain-containing histidine kinase [Oscillospiraceae bacterium]|nr:HAMP domain-containing histidine kinase [Oscillospiraceae bacterium]
MIRQLRIKLIVAAMVSLAIVLLVILGSVNLVSRHKIVTDADAILDVLIANEGAFPPTVNGRPGVTAPPPEWALSDDDDLWEDRDDDLWEDWDDDDAFFENGRHFNAPVLSPEAPYESRYFSVVLSEDGTIIAADVGQVAAVDAGTAGEYARAVWESGSERGFYGDYRYAVSDEESGTRIVFLDRGRVLSDFRTTLLASVAVALAGLAAVLVLLILLSKRIVRPVAESYEKQRRFITDAGHELKTPLTVIGADAELAELECGENEWLADIKRQTLRLTDLTNDLIYLSRMDEERPLQMLPFPFSDVVEETAQSFQSLARTQGKAFQTDIQPMISCTGDEKALRQLVSILLDNALKYTPPEGSIALGLERRSRNIRLTVSNTTARPVETEQLNRLFDRFYRADDSRSSKTGGYGLGLSIAKSIVLAHRGKIRAETPDGGHTLTVTAILPEQRSGGEA